MSGGLDTTSWTRQASTASTTQRGSEQPVRLEDVRPAVRGALNGGGLAHRLDHPLGLLAQRGQFAGLRLIGGCYRCNSSESRDGLGRSDKLPRTVLGMSDPPKKASAVLAERDPKKQRGRGGWHLRVKRGGQVVHVCAIFASLDPPSTHRLQAVDIAPEPSWRIFATALWRRSRTVESATGRATPTWRGFMPSLTNSFMASLSLKVRPARS